MKFRGGEKPPVPKFESESALCEDFMTWLRGQAGWTPYAETAGWDILCVHSTGLQVGIQAKQRLTFEVINQAIARHHGRRGECGPDFRAVLVPAIPKDAKELLATLKLVALAPHFDMGWRRPEAGDPTVVRNYEVEWKRNGYHGKVAFELEDQHRHYWLTLFRWHASERERVPEFVPDVKAGVPCPVQLTPWKIGALKACATAESRGSITTKEIKSLGVSNPAVLHDLRYLLRSDKGVYGVGDRMDRIIAEHPKVYAEIREQLKVAASLRTAEVAS